MKHVTKVTNFIVLVLSVGALAVQTDKSVLFTNAKIYTGTELSHSANTLLIKNGKFAAIGTLAQVTRLVEPQTQVVDLNKALVLPGFIESHAHLINLGLSKMELDLKGLSKEEIVDKVTEQSHQLPPNTWIFGRGWDQNLWANKQFPHKNSFAQISQPVVLKRVDGHAIWVNQAALKIAGIDKATKDPAGGQIVRDKGEPTGVLLDYAMQLVYKHTKKPEKKDLERYLDLGIDAALSKGITSFHDAGVGRDVIDLYADRAKNHALKLRIYAMLDGDDQQLVREFFSLGPVNINNFLTVRSVKYFADGALGSGGALMLNDYHDQPHSRGLALVDESDLAAKTVEALKNGFQVATHAIGDAANRLVLNAYERALKQTKNNDARLRIEHAQIIDPVDQLRFKSLSIIASMQPIHCIADMAWVTDRIGEAHAKDRAYPWRRLQNLGVILAFGSDAPVEDVNPIKGIYAAVTRTSLSNTKSFFPEQKLSLKEALTGYFGSAAFSEFSEHLKGKISIGHLADFVVLDTDILHPDKSTFLATEPLMTVVGGEIVFESPPPQGGGIVSACKAD